MEINHNNLPEAVQKLFSEVADIKKLLIQHQQQPERREDDKLLTVQQAAQLMSLSVPTVYGLIHRKEIPCMKRSKRVYFSHSDLMQYLKDGKRKTSRELDREAEDFIKRQSK